MVDNDRMLKNVPSNVIQSRLELLINDIDVNDQDQNLPDRIISDEEKLYQIILTLLAKILKIYHRAQLSIIVSFEPRTMMLNIKIMEDVATIMPDGSKNSLLGKNFENEDELFKYGSLEYVCSKAILKRYGGDLILNKNQIEIKLKTLKLDEFQRLPENMRTTQQIDGTKEFLPKIGSFISRVETKAYFNQNRDGQHYKQQSIGFGRSATLLSIP